MYAFNTGVGTLKSVRIGPDEVGVFQRNLIRSHSAGVGEPMPDDAVRAMMLLRANAFASNYSGVRLEIVERLLAMLSAGIIPIIAAKGSVGASGDLAPLALMSGALMGLPESRVRYRGAVVSASSALANAGITPTINVQAKEGTALTNGATASLAYAVLAAWDARRLLDCATVSLCLSLEALRAELSCFEERVMQARPHPGQIRVAASMRKLLDGTQRCTENARQIGLWGMPGLGAANAGMPLDPPLWPRIQDVYSLRCAPQVLRYRSRMQCNAGACKTALLHFRIQVTIDQCVRSIGVARGPWLTRARVFRSVRRSLYSNAASGLRSAAACPAERGAWETAAGRGVLYTRGRVTPRRTRIRWAAPGNACARTVRHLRRIPASPRPPRHP